MRSKNRDTMERMKAYAEEYARENGGKTPSTAEFGKAFRMSRQSAFRYLKEMDALGMIRYEDGRVHTGFIDKIVPPGRLGYAFSEGISAGPAQEAEGEIDSVFAIPPIFVDGRKGTFFVLRVHGDSMKDAGISEGDLVICRQQETARPREIVAAYIRGEGCTLKRYCKDGEGPYLWAENDGWSRERRFFGRAFEIQGVAVKVLKEIDFMKRGGE